MWKEIKPLFSVRFFMFCCVGLSGVAVNLGCLAVLADILRVQLNLASALAIWVSINSNFFINEVWTFRDRRPTRGGLLQRWAKFHLVSIVGALIQWTVFVIANMVWLMLFFNDSGQRDLSTTWFDLYIVNPITEPRDVGVFKYISQLFGVGAATFWNFFANFYWTWKKSSKEGHES